MPGLLFFLVELLLQFVLKFFLFGGEAGLGHLLEGLIESDAVGRRSERAAHPDRHNYILEIAELTRELAGGDSVEPQRELLAREINAAAAFDVELRRGEREIIGLDVAVGHRGAGGEFGEHGQVETAAVDTETLDVFQVVFLNHLHQIDAVDLALDEGKGELAVERAPQRGAVRAAAAELQRDIAGAGHQVYRKHITAARADRDVAQAVVHRNAQRVATRIEAEVAAIAPVVEPCIEWVQADDAVTRAERHVDIAQLQLRDLERADAKLAVDVEFAQGGEGQGGRAGGRCRAGRRSDGRSLGRGRRQIAVCIDAIQRKLKANGGLGEIAHAGAALQGGLIELQIDITERGSIAGVVELHAPAQRLQDLGIGGDRRDRELLERAAYVAAGDVERAVV